MNIKKQIQLSVVISLILTAVISASLVVSYPEMQDLQEQESLAADLVRGGYELTYLVNDYIVNGEPRARLQWEERYASLQPVISQLKPGNSEEADTIEVIRDYYENIARVFHEIPEPESLSAGAVQINPLTQQVMWSRNNVQSQGLIYEAWNLRHSYNNDVTDARNWNYLLVIILMTAMLLVIIVNYLLISRRLVRSIREINDGSKVFATGNLAYRIPVSDKDEMGEIAEGLNVMAEDLMTVTASRDDLNREIAERKQAEEELRASEIRYRRLFEAAQDGILILNAGTGEIVDVNPYLINLLGFSREQFLGKKLWELGVFRDVVANKDNFEELQRKGFIRYEDLPLETADGKQKAVEFVSNIYTVENKKVVQCNIRDVTERKQAEESLRESETNYHDILDNAGDLIQSVNPDGYFLFVNRTWYETLGYTEDEIHNLNILDIIHPDSQAKCMGIFQRVLGGEIVDTIQTQFISKDGTVIDVEGTANCRFIDGKPSATRSIFRDITERKQMEEALRESEIRFRTMSDWTQDWEYWLTHNREVVYCSPSIESITGYSADEFIADKNLIDRMIHPDDRALWEEHTPLHEEDQQSKDSTEIEFRIITKDGKTRWISHICRAIYADDGTWAGRRISNRDITKRKKAEDALRTINKKLNLLSSITRHDIINQVNAAEMFVELMGMENEIPQDSKGTLELKKVADALKTIERQIVFTRDYQDLGVLSPGWQKVGAIIDGTAATATKELTVVNEVGDLEIYADPLFEKVIFNLFDNAVRYGEKITTIRFTSEETPEGFNVVCEDDGVGIPADVKEKIFNRQYFKHTGLGLFLSREIVSITGMTIAETGVPGEGARFEISVPDGMWRYP